MLFFTHTHSPKHQQLLGHPTENVVKIINDIYLKVTAESFIP